MKGAREREGEREVLLHSPELAAGNHTPPPREALRHTFKPLCIVQVSESHTYCICKYIVHTAITSVLT